MVEWRCIMKTSIGLTRMYGYYGELEAALKLRGC